MWPHRPVGRVMFTLALGLVAAAALLLDTAAPPAADALVAWHALSTLALAGLAGWALWTPQLPRDSGRSLAALLALVATGNLLVTWRTRCRRTGPALATPRHHCPAESVRR